MKRKLRKRAAGGSAAAGEETTAAEAEAAAEAEVAPEEEAEVPRKPRKRRRAAAAAAAGAAEEDGDDGVLVATPRAASASSASSTAVAAAKPSAKGGLFRVETSFAQLGLATWLVESCSKMGMRYPTDVQALTIPHILAGKNVAGNAKTGSGKTACYCLPALHELSKDPYGVFELILTPVRELAFQISENFQALGKAIGVQVAEIVGGREMLHQSKTIAERRHIIVATPGRLADLLRGDPALAAAFRRLRTFVLDEADRLLTSTFEEPLAEILAVLPKTRQTLLFSATITRSIEKLQASLSAGGKELMLLDTNPEDESLENLTQEYIFVPKVVQVCYLHFLLKEHFPDESCILFAPTIDLCQLLTTMFELLEFPVTGLHSLQSQRQRQACLGKFKAGRAKILIATDVAGRGLDIPKVNVVINLGLPRDTDDYVHRAGRTARAGRKGLVLSLLSEEDVPRVKGIEERIGGQLSLRPVNEEDAVKLLSRTSKARQKAELLLSEVGFEERVSEHRQARKTRRNQNGTDKKATAKTTGGNRS
eukprot:TRINITY_DN72121_c0_g1_i1.p1 TRINITY_DN72121_c0_g1~~TRINITY_DN72121_c0_g1_i1.p1  ORF type:complete len:538 (-),score=140.70 TRINITY_DN72121_c0_g1_i1:111-1724(-)